MHGTGDAPSAVESLIDSDAPGCAACGARRRVPHATARNARWCRAGDPDGYAPGGY
ncbi:hypothetical protein [Frankia sp. CiP1_Cm_nod1]|uniref:hypothetical protein n=1 Tax=Frankia sp. CiP1_Cm_nod1 TaxID=2897160 RepID=UPI002023FE8E